MDSIIAEIRAMETRMNTRMDDMETRMGTRMDGIEDNIKSINSSYATMEKRMDTKMDSIEGTIKSINSSIDTMHTAINADLTTHNKKIDTLENNVQHIYDGVKLGVYSKKSFWKDGWLLSALMIPAAQLVSGYITTYAGPNNIIVVNDCKKNN